MGQESFRQASVRLPALQTLGAFAQGCHAQSHLYDTEFASDLLAEYPWGQKDLEAKARTANPPFPLAGAVAGCSAQSLQHAYTSCSHSA